MAFPRSGVWRQIFIWRPIFVDFSPSYIWRAIQFEICQATLEKPWDLKLILESLYGTICINKKAFQAGTAGT